MLLSYMTNILTLIWCLTYKANLKVLLRHYYVLPRINV